MHCNKCGSDNRDSAKFCSECGAELVRSCDGCSATLSATAKFCDNCGKPASAAPAPEQSANTKAEALSREDRARADDANAERRHLTVLFCDLVGSTAISELVDPEDMRNILAAYQERCRTIVEKYRGKIARYIGDGILIYFGYPVAYEDAVDSALYAALEIARDVGELGGTEDIPDVDLQVRIGINSGGVIVGDIGSGEAREHMAVVGDVPNVAARMQSLAQPGQVMVGEPTQALAGPMFNFDDLGPKALKGIREPVHVFHLRGASQAVSRSDSPTKFLASKIVGREAELTLLEDRLERAASGEGQVVLVSGEAGIGKSRIVQRSRRDLDENDYALVTLYCSSHYRSSALFPLQTYIERNIDIHAADDNAKRLKKLLGWLRSTSQESDLSAYAFLLQLELPATEDRVEPAPMETKQRLFHVLLDYFESLTEEKPLVILVEDFHSSDPSTSELLGLWLEKIENKRCMMVVTFREDFDLSWSHRNYVTSLQLNRLSTSESFNVINSLTDGKALPREVIDQIIVKTDGVPLFLEELTKMVLESDLLADKGDHYELTGPLPPLAIPESLHDSLMARLDRLSTVKDVVQLAAVLGRNFDHELLAVASQLAPEDFDKAIRKLLDAELIFKSGMPPDVVYEFKHALVQETAYRNLLKNTRVRYHRRFALLLGEKFPERVEAQPEYLAYHYTEANMSEEAVRYWLEAGNRAIARSANVEAIDHLRNGLKANADCPDSAEKTQNELTLQIALAIPLTAVHGYASETVEDTYTKARELSKKVGKMDLLFPSIYGMWRFYLLSAQFAKAETLSRELVMLAKETDRVAFIMAAHRAVGSTQFYLGNIADSRENLQIAIDTNVSPEERSGSLLYDVVDAAVAAHAYQAWNHWLSGFPDQARKEAEYAIKTASEISHQFSKALALCFGSWTYQFCGDREKTLDLAQQSRALSVDYGFGFWLGWAGMIEAWGLGDSVDAAERLQKYETSLEEWLVTGSKLGQTYFLQLTAFARADAGNFDEALAILNEADAFAKESGEKWWYPEMLRARGEVLLSQGDADATAIRELFEQALEIAEQQKALSLQLRILMSIYRLQSTSNSKETQGSTREKLAALYNQFSEGHDTADLVEAKKLLA